MCLILTSKSLEIKKEYLECGFKSNGHGSGFSYRKDNKLVIEKGFFSFDEFYSAYQKTIGLPIIVHFRFRTHGKTDKENCHPFIINDDLHFVHNGVLYNFNQNADMSDTFNFCEERLKPLTRDTKGKKWWKNKGFKWLIEGVIGNNNKLAFLDSDGEITIFNEEAGEWVDKEKTIWASNNSYKVLKTRNDPRTTYTQNYMGGWSGYESDYLLPDKQDITPTPPTQSGSTLLLENKENQNNNDCDQTKTIWEVSAEELKEVDDYLETLNQ